MRKVYRTLLPHLSFLRAGTLGMHEVLGVRCPMCGYDLAGHSTRLPRCPECAHQMTEADLAAPQAHVRRRVNRACLLFLLSPIPAGLTGVTAGFAINPAFTFLIYFGFIWLAATRWVYLELPEQGLSRLLAAAMAGIPLTASLGLVVGGAVVAASTLL